MEPARMCWANPVGKEKRLLILQWPFILPLTVIKTGAVPRHSDVAKGAQSAVLPTP